MAEDWTKLTLDPGDRVAGFEIESFVARGGMAVVYRARDVSLGRTVALKVIAPELAQNEKFRLRFMRESELAASLDHPNVIPIYAAGESNDLLYLVMRFVRGDDLGTVLRNSGPLSPRVALPIFTQVAGGLDAAHARQLVHRDVKPGNILLAGEEEIAQRHVYLSDFGLTKRLSSLTGVTTAGHFLGTINYVAPEQVEGKPVDHRSDIYSFGCVLFEALAGEPPFAGDDDAALLWAHIAAEPPRISERRPDLPAALDPVLQRALAKDADDRPQDCRTLVSELRTAFRSGANRGGSPPGRTRPPARPKSGAPSQRPSAARPGPGRAGPPGADRVRRPALPVRRPRLGLLALLAAVVLLLGGGGWFLLGRDTWVSRSGQELSEAAVVLDHPKRWAPVKHGGQYIVLAPTDLTGIFTPEGDWAPARRTGREAPQDLVGAYVTTTKALDVSGFIPMEDQLSDQFVGVEFQTTDPQDPPPGAPNNTQRVSGMLRPAGGTDPVLYYDLVVQPSSTAKERPGVVLLFCRAEDRAANQETFDRVSASMRTL